MRGIETVKTLILATAILAALTLPCPQADGEGPPEHASAQAGRSG